MEREAHHRLAAAQRQQTRHELGELAPIVGARPVDPGDGTVDVVRIVVASLGPGELVAHHPHGRAGREQQQREVVLHLLHPQLRTAVPRMMSVIGDRGEVVHGQAVVRGDEVERPDRPVGTEQVGAALHPLADGAHHPWLTAQQPADLVPEAVVPLEPDRPGPSVAELVAAHVPRLGDERDASRVRPLRDQRHQTATIPGEQRRQVEAEAVHSEIRIPVEGLDHQLPDPGVTGVDVVPAAAVVRRTVVLHAIDGRIHASESGCRRRRLVLARVVEHDVDPDVHAAPVRCADQLGQLLRRPGRVLCVVPMDRAPHQRHVPPVVGTVVEGMHRHQLDDVGSDRRHVIEVVDAAPIRAAESLHVEFVDHRRLSQRSALGVDRPCGAVHAARAVVGHDEVVTTGVEERLPVVDGDPVRRPRVGLERRRPPAGFRRVGGDDDDPVRG